MCLEGILEVDFGGLRAVADSCCGGYIRPMELKECRRFWVWSAFRKVSVFCSSAKKSPAHSAFDLVAVWGEYGVFGVCGEAL